MGGGARLGTSTIQKREEAEKRRNLKQRKEDGKGGV